jgi:RNA polymerase sigma factor (sigma-70 family)
MTGDSQPDVSLLDALARGEPDAFWPLWQRHAPRLFAVCLAEMNGNRAEAEDALGFAMMKALAKLPPAACEILSPSAWLVRMTRNLCKDIHRQRARVLRAEAELNTLNSHSEPETETDSLWDLDADPATLIASLPPRLREVLTLRAIQRMAYNDIAAKLKLTCANARKRVQQARKALRQNIHK